MSTKSTIEWTAARHEDGATTPGKTWAPMPGFPGYWVSDAGLVRSTRTVLKPIPQPTGHQHVFLYRAGTMHKMYVHQAVLRAFVGERPVGMQCRHLNGNPQDNRLSNLAWGTALENSNDKDLHGTRRRGDATRAAKLTEAQVVEIRARYGTATLRALAAEYGVSHTCIRRAAVGLKWAHVEGAIHGR